MKAVLQDKYGGAEVLQVGETENPAPEKHQVVVKVAATSVNRADIIQREGNYNQPPGDSPILGLEVAGVVDELGPGVTGFKTGERVMSLVGGGGYAEYASAYASHLMKIPKSMSFEQAACVSETYITAYLNVFTIACLKDGETVLLHGGGGGVNTSAIQLCKTLMPDVTVLVTASTGKTDRVRVLGADHVIDYKTEDFAEAVRTFTSKKGVDIILDHIGGKYLTQNLKSLAVGGRLVIIGLMGGAKSEINIAPLMVKRQQILGSVLRSRPVEEKTRITEEFSQNVLPLFAEGHIEPLIHQVLPLEEVAEAHRIMEASAHFGKIVLTL
jgi:putative PIG3 family NAD(P)H quinone oxidoreductase